MDDNKIDNHLLAALDKGERDNLLRVSEAIQFPRKRILYEAGQPIHSAYFFLTGMASLFVVAEDGRMVQIAVVGSDGFVGVPIVLMGTKSSSRIITQTPVEALKVSATQLVARFNESARLREILLNYSQVLNAQVAQSALCNPLHTIRQRLCRWLLIYRDATGSDSLYLTQQDLANMIGSHRNQVSLEVRVLGKLGLIQHARGQLTIVKPDGLKEASCECYRVARHWATDLLDC